MTVTEFIESATLPDGITKEMVIELQDNKELRKGFVHHFREHKNRDFALALLNKIVEIRNTPSNADDTFIEGETLIYGCYLLGLNGYVEDALKVWEVKMNDFDTYCFVDVQLAVFAGVYTTLLYLKGIDSKEAADAYEYIEKCAEAGDFEDIDEYYSRSTMPWFV